MDLLTRATSGFEIWGGVDLPHKQVTPKMSSPKTKHFVCNRRFLANGQELGLERKNSKSKLDARGETNTPILYYCSHMECSVFTFACN
jgi:hypothetical protein